MFLIDIDYSNLEEGLTEVDDMDDVRKVEKTLEKQIGDLQSKITGIQAPNMRAMQKLVEAREKLEETNKEFDNARPFGLTVDPSPPKKYVMVRTLANGEKVRQIVGKL